MWSDGLGSILNMANRKLNESQTDSATLNSEGPLWPTTRKLLRMWRLKHGRRGQCGPRATLRRRFGYFTPNDYYEAVLDEQVTPETRWLDVGCGRNLLPGNPRLAGTLSSRCMFLQGVDPDPTITDNELCHACSNEPIETYCSENTFDLVTLRMVAEHVDNPVAVVMNLAKLTRPGGKVVVYTVNRWSPLSITARIVPHRLHHPIKRFFWKTEEQDTFPVRYRMNTRHQLSNHFCAHGFRTVFCRKVSDCSALWHFPMLYRFELAMWRLLTRFGYSYPETNLLGVFERE